MGSSPASIEFRVFLVAEPSCFSVPASSTHPYTRSTHNLSTVFLPITWLPFWSLRAGVESVDTTNKNGVSFRPFLNGWRHLRLAEPLRLASRQDKSLALAEPLTLAPSPDGRTVEVGPNRWTGAVERPEWSQSTPPKRMVCLFALSSTVGAIFGWRNR